MMRLILICIAVSGGLVSPALAHIGVGQTDSFASGIAHPLHGTDHVLAMLTVGVWGVLAGGRAIWVWPMAFVATMLAGVAAASLGLRMPFVEPAIWSSVIVLGLLVALAIKAPVWLGTAMTGLFAFFHGHVHGTEAVSGNLIPYAAGFSLATAGLLAAGIWLGFFAERSIGKVALRAMGGLTVLGGIFLIAG
jgi:urease accessory protein